MPLHVPAVVIPQGTPVSKVDRYSGNDADYETVVSWTVGTGKKGELKEVSMISDTYAKTEFKLTIASEEQFADIIIQAPLTLPFPENSLLAGSVILLECRSTDGTAIVVDGSIVGREI